MITDSQRAERKNLRVGSTFTVVPGSRRLTTFGGDALHHRDDRKGRPLRGLRSFITMDDLLHCAPLRPAESSR